MSLTLRALICEGEAIIKDAADARTRQGEALTHINSVADWHRRAATFVAARSHELASQMPQFTSIDTFDEIYVTVTTTLNLLKAVEDQATREVAAGKDNASGANNSTSAEREKASSLQALLFEYLLPTSRRGRIAVLLVLGIGSLALMLWAALPDEVKSRLLTPAVKAASERVLEKTIEWTNPIQIARNGDDLKFSLAEAIPVNVGKGSEVRIEEITFSANVESETPTSFSFDLEVLLSPSRDGLEPAVLNGSDFGKWKNLHEEYAVPRRMVRITVNTGQNRTPGAAAPIVWRVDALRGATGGHLQTFKGGPVIAADDEVYVQLFAWTLWTGNNAMEFRDTRLTLKLLIKGGAAIAGSLRPSVVS